VCSSNRRHGGGASMDELRYLALLASFVATRYDTW
jgi:hypothetical protein